MDLDEDFASAVVNESKIKEMLSNEDIARLTRLTFQPEVLPGHGPEPCAVTHRANTEDVGTLLSLGPPPAPTTRPLYLVLGPGAATNLGCTLARELGVAKTHWHGAKGGCFAPLSLPPGSPGHRARQLVVVCLDAELGAKVGLVGLVGLVRALAGHLPAAREPGEELAALGRALLRAAATLAGTSEQELPK